MTKLKIGMADKNLQNVVEDLDKPKINAHQAQQQQQQTNDRRHQDQLNDEGDELEGAR